MDVLILHTVGRRSRQPRQSPVAWFADGPDAWLIVASGGREHPGLSKATLTKLEGGTYADTWRWDSLAEMGAEIIGEQ